MTTKLVMAHPRLQLSQKFTFFSQIHPGWNLEGRLPLVSSCVIIGLNMINLESWFKELTSIDVFRYWLNLVTFPKTAKHFEVVLLLCTKHVSKWVVKIQNKNELIQWRSPKISLNMVSKIIQRNLYGSIRSISTVLC